MSATVSGVAPGELDPRSRQERETEMGAAMWPPDGHPRLACQEPAWDVDCVASHVLTVSGWAIGPTGTPSVSVAIGSLATHPGLGFARPDVAADFPEPGAAESGWAVTLRLEELPPGVHRMTVAARDPAGPCTSITRFVRVEPERAYRTWLERREPVAPMNRSVAAGTLPVWIDPDGAAPSALEATRASLDAQAGAGWSALEPDGLGELLGRVADGSPSWAVLVQSGDVLEPHALRAIAERLAATGSPDLIYADDDALDADGRRCGPRFKPQWSPELLLSRDYVGGFLAIGSRAARRALAAEPGPPSGAYDLLLRLVDEDLWVERIPDVLVTRRPREPADGDAAELVRAVARRRGASAELRPIAPGLRDVGWLPRGEPSVSIVIVTGRRRDLLQRCLATLRERTAYPSFEVVVVDNGGLADAPLTDDLAGLDARVVEAPGPFNYSRLNNLGVEAAGGDLLVFLNDDIELETPGWLGRLVGHCQQPGVGVVGVKLVFPNGLINHAGVLLTSEQPIARLLYNLFPADDAGDRGELVVTRNCTAVGTSCAMMPRALFDSLDGFDEGLAVELGDIDLCLRAQEAGRRVVWTPSVVATHHERASRGGAVFIGDWARFATRWDRTLHAGDPYWSPHLLDEPQGEIRAAPPSAAELALRSSRIPSDGPPTRPVRSPVRDDDRALRPSAERFVPETMGGSMIQAEHEARYRWAATIVAGKQVLDAGSGVGYGTQICSEAGAARVVGVDVSEHALADARALGRGAAAEFVVGDLLELPFPARSFDVVVCFEAIEHVEDVERVLDELRRVLRDDGVLLISSPNRGVYPGGNPHHVHELTSDELSEALGRRFANVGLHRQSSWAATLIADDAAQRHSSSGEPIDGTMRKVVGRELGAELYTVAAASDAPLPQLGGISVMCDPVVSDPVFARIEYSEKLVTAADAAAAEARRQLAAAERELAAADAGRAFAERVAEDLQASASWRVTAPLRALKRLAANRRRAARAR